MILARSPLLTADGLFMEDYVNPSIDKTTLPNYVPK